MASRLVWKIKNRLYIKMDTATKKWSHGLTGKPRSTEEKHQANKTLHKASRIKLTNWILEEWSGNGCEGKWFFRPISLCYVSEYGLSRLMSSNLTSLITKWTLQHEVWSPSLHTVYMFTVYTLKSLKCLCIKHANQTEKNEAQEDIHVSCTFKRTCQYIHHKNYMSRYNNGFI